ncbi:hypothetical protein B7R21_02200 [Subtercola boreus]|uniref:Phosphoribosylformylglycinamidine synthase I n=1 Tax=Subtercola boreus TaxID=120213 RepID=A0A3E0W2Z7_9MICO|nr:hypothetical protein B7R21_02200 [Subtercola boreus]
MLPGGLIRNDHGNFICRDQRLRVENTSTAWTSGYAAAARDRAALAGTGDGPGGSGAAGGPGASGTAGRSGTASATGDFASSAASGAPEITIPLKNGEGGYIASAETIARLEGEGLVAFRYLDVNPNGSMNDIAGVTNARGNVVGLMPHPEHAVEPGFGPDTALAMRSGIDGLPLFASLLASLLPA